MAPVAGDHPVEPETRSVLVVSEDPGFIIEVQERFQPLGVKVVGCLGPAASPCQLEYRRNCSLADHSSMVIVDAPRSGVFGRRWNVLPAGAYAERLAAAHPDTFVVLCGAPDGTSGPSGDVTHVSSRAAAKELIAWSMVPVPQSVSLAREE
jgi:hypothetical protein